MRSAEVHGASDTKPDLIAGLRLPLTEMAAMIHERTGDGGCPPDQD
jgi:hypothetical protein